MTSTLQLTGKTALVTGGSRGIGAAIVRRLAEEGVAVAINYRSGSAAAEALVQEITEKGGQAQAFQADVSDPAQPKKLVEQVTAALGGLDLLVSNAGIEHFGALESITLEDFDRVFHTNVAGQLFMTQAAVPAMSSGGRIVLSSSVSAISTVRHHAVYAASKAAVRAMVRNLAPELADRGISINAIAPGGTNTDMAAEHTKSYIPPALAELGQDAFLKSKTALGRWGDPSEIAAVVVFLLSPDASYITGTTVEANGGWM